MCADLDSDRFGKYGVHSILGTLRDRGKKLYDIRFTKYPEGHEKYSWWDGANIRISENRKQLNKAEVQQHAPDLLKKFLEKGKKGPVEWDRGSN